EIEVPVAQADALVDVLLVELERQGVRAREDPQLVDLELDRAGRQVRVHGVRRTRRDLSLRLEHELVADGVRYRGGLGRPIRVDDELDDACVVAQVDEDQAAVVAPTGRPPGQLEAFADVAAARLAAVAVAIAHRSSSARRRSSESSTVTMTSSLSTR